MVEMVSVSCPVLPFKGERVIIDKEELWEENSAWLEVKLSLQDGLSPWVKEPATELENAWDMCVIDESHPSIVEVTSAASAAVAALKSLKILKGGTAVGL